MRGNEFEKRVQEEMEDLHLRPSTTVWEGVEKELKKKKRRRVVFYMSMLAGLGLLGYMGFNFFSQENTQLAKQSKEQQLQTDKTSNNSSNSSSDNNTTTIGSSLHDQANNNTNTNAKEKINQSTRQQVDQSVNQSINPSAKASKFNPTGQLIVKQRSSGIGKNDPDKRKPQQQAPIEDKPISITLSDGPLQPVIDKDNSAKNNTDIATNIPQADIQNSVPGPVKKDSAKIDLKTDLPDATKQDIAIAKPKKGKKLSIKIGFEGSIGKNFSRNNSFRLPSAGYIIEGFSPGLEKFYDNASLNTPIPPQSAANGGYTGYYGGGFVRPPSPVTAELAFKAGVTAEIRLTKRSSILTGLRYSYQSESLEVGQQGFASNLAVNRWQGSMDALQNFYAVNQINGSGSPANPLMSPSQYYTGGYYFGPRSEKYMNRYHFLELPLSYQWQVINGRKIQVLWNGGATASVLLNTNALVYDTAAFGINYKNPNAYNKVHISLNSGLSVRFGQENKLQWSIGPEFSMDMTHVLKSDFILRDRYFMYGGITARVMLPGKK
jgi:hypothetical protein